VSQGGEVVNLKRAGLRTTNGGAGLLEGREIAERAGECRVYRSPDEGVGGVMDAARGGGDGQGDNKHHRANDACQKASRAREEHIPGNHEGILSGAARGHAAPAHQTDKNDGQYFCFHDWSL
jgi:hypothetical protein